MLTPNSIINLEECRIPRSPRALFDFTIGLFDRLSETPEGKSWLRFKKGHCKKLREEMFPIAIFGLATFGERPDVAIQCHFDDRPFDCTITNPLDQTYSVERIEMTSAIDGLMDRLRMEHFEQYGRAPAAIDIPAFGTAKNRRIPERKMTGVMGDDYRQELIARSVERIASKIDKGYDPNTTFALVLEAEVGLSTSWTLENLIDRLSKTVRPLCPTRRLICIETMHRLVIDFGRGPPNVLPTLAYSPAPTGSLDLLTNYP